MTAPTEAGIVFTRHPTGDLRLDLYRPAVAGKPAPVIIWLHGGGWFTGDRTLAPDLAGFAAATGCAVASIDYRLSGEALFPAQLHDVRAAIRFLRLHAGDYDLDPAAVGVWGASAGGHLAALAGLTGHLTQLPDEPDYVKGARGIPPVDTSVQAVAESYAPVDLSAVVAEATESVPGMDPNQAPESRLLGGHPLERPELARQANPLSWVSSAAPPFHISHGNGDVLVSSSQGERLHDALVAAGVETELYLLDGYKHGFLNPAGRLDVAMSKVMDDGRLAAEGRASALCRTSADPTYVQTTFGFAEVESFFVRHLNSATPAPSTTGDPQ